MDNLTIAEQCLHTIQAFLLVTPQVRSLGMCKELREDRTGDSQLTWPEGYPTPCAVMLSNKTRGRQRKRECVEWWFLSSQETIINGGALLCRGWLNTCLPGGSGERIPYFTLLAHTASALPIELSVSTHEFSHVHPSDSLPHPTGENEWVAVWGQAAGWA